MSKRYDGNASEVCESCGGTGRVEVLDGLGWLFGDRDCPWCESSDQEDANSKSVPSTSKGLEQASFDQEERASD